MIAYSIKNTEPKCDFTTYGHFCIGKITAYPEIFKEIIDFISLNPNKLYNKQHSLYYLSGEEKIIFIASMEDGKLKISTPSKIYYPDRIEEVVFHESLTIDEWLEILNMIKQKVDKLFGWNLTDEEIGIERI